MSATRPTPTLHDSRPEGRRAGGVRSPLGVAGLVASLLASAMLAGCGDRDPLGRRAVSGEVTIDGESLDGGSILFEPAMGGPGMAVGAAIRGGRFAIPRRDGPTPGVYLVRVYASSGIQAPPAEGQSARKPRPMVERVPARYNARTTLRVEVAADGRNTFCFELAPEGDP